MNRATAALTLALLACVACAGPTQAAYHPPRTASGDPDLQGEWTNLSLTQLERSDKTPHQALTDAEAAALEKRILDHIAAPPDPKTDAVGQKTSEWFDLGHLARINGVARSSYIVDPANGQLPYNDAGAKMQKRWDDTDFSGFDNPEDRPTGERCLMSPGGAFGPPIITIGHNNDYKIVQSKGVVAIYSEIANTVRIIRLNAAHIPAAIHPWTGDSIGHWEGDVLVVETTQFNPGETNRDQYQISPDAKVVERFWRTSPSEILYSFTVTDPTYYKQPWSGQIPMRATNVPMFEFACHEGNYALPDILAGARETEAKAKAAGVKTATK